MGLGCLLAFAGAALVLTWLCRPRGLADAVLAFAICLAGGILIAGYTLSELNAIGRVEVWALFGALGFALTLGAAWFRLRKAAERDAILEWLRQVPAWFCAAWSLAARGYRQLSAFERFILSACSVTACILALVNLGLVVLTAPHCWDSMTYHLARLAYYLQHGSLATYDANYWAQVTHPKNATVLLIFAYQASGRNENLTQLVQFASYLVASLAVYGISRRMGNRRYASLLAAAIFALLVECLMQASTTQNDMLVAALVGCSTYGLFSFRESRRPSHLTLALAATTVALGVKASVVLVLPSLAIVGIHGLSIRSGAGGGSFRSLWRFARRGAGVCALGLVAGGVCVAPTGYAENWLVYGHPVGPEYVRKLHSFEGEPLGDVLIHGTRNLLRFGFEFLSLDGMPPYRSIVKAQSLMRQAPASLLRALGIDLETREGTRSRFSYDKAPSAHEDLSYWGVFGFGLLLPLLLGALAGRIRSAPGRILALACVAFWLAQAYSGPYDPWRGRYFVIMAVLAAPVVGCWIGRSHVRKVRIYVGIVVLLGCSSGFAAVMRRSHGAPHEVVRLDRLAQLTRNRPTYTEALRRYEELVPPGATVAVHLPEDSYEYPLFGEKLTRTLIPINGFRHGPQPIPAQADFLLYSSESYEDRHASDIHLGEDWYLRVL